MRQRSSAQVFWGDGQHLEEEDLARVCVGVFCVPHAEREREAWATLLWCPNFLSGRREGGFLSNVTISPENGGKMPQIVTVKGSVYLVYEYRVVTVRDQCT